LSTPPLKREKYGLKEGQPQFKSSAEVVREEQEKSGKVDKTKKLRAYNS